MSKLPRMFAEYLQTLVYFDGPQLALLRNRKGTPILAIAIADEVPGFEQPYLANPIPERILSDYLNQKVDLNFTMRHRRGGGHYIFDWVKLKKEVLMDRIESIDVDPEDFYPEPGFFFSQPY